MAANDKGTKRSKLGNRVQRGIYKAAHGYKHPWYADLCIRASNMSDKVSTSRKEAKIDMVAQLKIPAQLEAAQKAVLAIWALTA